MSHSIKYNYLLNYAKTVSGMLFPLITFAYASRVLSVEGIGRIDFVRNVVSFFILFATLGVATYGTREGAKERENRQGLSRLVRELLTINIITTIISYAVLIVMVLFVPKLKDYQDIFFIYGLCIGFTALGLEWLYNALEDFEYITIRYIAFQLISLILLVLFVKSKEDYLIYTGILTFSTVGSNVLNFIHSRKYVDLGCHKRVSIHKHIKPILVLFSNSIIGSIYLSLDSIMLGWIASPYNVGLYSAANKMNRVVLTIITSLFIVILPRASYYIKKQETQKFNELLHKSIHFVIFMALPLACLLFLLSKDIILILCGTDFLPAVSCSRILSVIVVLIPLSTMASTEIIIPNGLENKLLISSIAGAIINVFLNTLLIPYYKENGAAIASVIAELSVTLITLYYAFKRVNFIRDLRNIWHYVLATLIMIIVLYPIGVLIDGVIRCVVFCLVGIIVYIFILFILKDKLLDEFYINIKVQTSKLLKKYENN